MTMFDLSGKQATVTGGASGIGLAIARTLAGHGAHICILDLNVAVAEAAASSLGDGHQGLSCDVSSEESVMDAFSKMARATDILVNSAGIAHVGSLGTTSPADLDRLYQVNVRGTYLCMRAALAEMETGGGGVIVNIASIAATAGLSDRFAYSMTKGAVLAMTLSVAKDYITRGIRCNCISPARVYTPFVEGFLAKNFPGQESEKRQSLEMSQPIGRMGKPEEVASLALYLCSDEASFLTGVNYPLDGGFLNLR